MQEKYNKGWTITRPRGAPVAMGQFPCLPASSTARTAEAQCGIKEITAAGSATPMDTLAGFKPTPATGI